MTPIQEEKTYIKYARQVLSGEQVAGHLIKLACERFVNNFYRDDVYFDYADVDQKITFISNFYLTEAPFSGQPFVLLPYQQWMIAGIFGFKHCNNDERIVNNVLLFMARKQGKTCFAAALMLAAIMCDGQTGVSGYTIANTASQSALAYKHISDLCASVDPKQRLFKRFRQSMKIPYTNAEIKVLAADATKLDGLNSQIFIQDEAHATKTTDLWAVMKTGQGARKNSLAIIITTAGYLVGDEYFLYAKWKMNKQILEGAIDDDTWFAALYQLDETDDWKDEANWIKACPSLGTTVSYDSLRKDVNEALNSPISEVDVKTKQLNMWCTSSETWMSNEKIEAVTQAFDYDIFDKEHEFSIIGVDIAERSDLCVLTSLVEHGDKLYLKAHPFICKDALENQNKDLYSRWIKAGYLNLIDDASVDINEVVKKLFELNDKLPVGLIAYDPFNATQLCIAAKKEGLPMRAVRQNLVSFTEPTLHLEHLIKTKKVVIDDNPIIRWCFSNVRIKRDDQGNCKPVKESKGSPNKIDIIIGFVQSLKLWMEVNKISHDPIEAQVLD